MAGVARHAPGNLILIGYRGCGKTAVGRELAARLGRPFMDTDEQIVAREGHSIREIFQQRGEAAFRAAETRVLEQVLTSPAPADRRVISVGGGAVLSDENRRRLKAAGVCIWLTAPPEELHRRLLADPVTAANRPALTERDALTEIRHLLAVRGPLYAAIADHIVETAGRSVADVVNLIVGLLEPPSPHG
ncbi:MAG: shikimate kinase [Planctomycetota bacterium]